MVVETASYDDLVGAVRGGNSVTFCSAAEDLSSGEKGKIFETGVRSTASRLVHLQMAVA